MGRLERINHYMELESRQQLTDVRKGEWGLCKKRPQKIK